jgi:hypothetical protein
MRYQKGVVAVTLFFVLAFFVAMAQAAEEKVDLNGKLWERVKGEAVITDAAEGQKEIKLQAKGLEPNSVYTVWFVKDNPQMGIAGVGDGDHSFTTDAEGAGEYTATVAAEELSNWEKIEVAFHPDGNPSNLKDIKIAMKGDLESAEEAR